MKPWKIEDGLKLIRALQSRVTEFGYHITLGGSVLNDGVSDRDLDLYFLPLVRPEPTDPRGLVSWLTVLWGQPKNRENSPTLDRLRVPPVRSEPIRIASEPWTVQAVAAPTRFLAEDEPSESEEVRIYKHQLKFERAGSDRIDVFII